MKYCLPIIVEPALCSEKHALYLYRLDGLGTDPARTKELRQQLNESYQRYFALRHELQLTLQFYNGAVAEIKNLEDEKV